MNSPQGGCLRFHREPSKRDKTSKLGQDGKLVKWWGERHTELNVLWDCIRGWCRNPSLWFHLSPGPQTHLSQGHRDTGTCLSLSPWEFSPSTKLLLFSPWSPNFSLNVVFLSLRNAHVSSVVGDKNPGIMRDPFLFSLPVPLIAFPPL